MNTTTTIRPFGLAVAAPKLRAHLAALMAQYGYDEVYPVTAADGDGDTAVVLRADTDHRLYLTASDGYLDAGHLRWPVLFDTNVVRVHEVTEPVVYLGLVMTLGAISAELDALPGPSVARSTCGGCRMQFDPAVGCCWCAGGPPLIPGPDDPAAKAERAALRAATTASRRQCERCGRNAGADPEWHPHRFGHAAVVAAAGGGLLEFDGERFGRAVVIGANGSTVPAETGS